MSFTGIPIFFMGIPVVFRYFGDSCDPFDFLHLLKEDKEDEEEEEDE